MSSGEHSHNLRYYTEKDEPINTRSPESEDYIHKAGLYSITGGVPLVSILTGHSSAAKRDLNQGIKLGLSYPEPRNGFLNIAINPGGTIGDIYYDAPESVGNHRKYRILQEPPKKPFKFLIITPFAGSLSNIPSQEQTINEQDLTFVTATIDLQRGGYLLTLYGNELFYGNFLHDGSMSLKEFAELLERYRRIQQNRRFIQ